MSDTGPVLPNAEACHVCLELLEEHCSNCGECSCEGWCDNWSDYRCEPECTCDNWSDDE